MRIFMGLAEVSGYFSNLKKGFDSIGVESELITLTTHRFGYGDKSRSIWVSFAQYSVGKKAESLFGAFPVRAFWSGMLIISRLCLFVWALIRFDVFIFNCGTSFFRFREFPVLKFFGKRIIYSFHGTDSRPGFLDGFAEDIFLPTHMRNGSNYIPPFEDGDTQLVRNAKLEAYKEITSLRRAKVDQIGRYADVIVDSPPHGLHHTRPFVNRLIIGLPYVLAENLTREKDKPKKDRVETDEVVVLHSPSYAEGKGTPGIRNAINSLKAKGLNIRFVEVTNRPNHEVLELITQCDFVVDQLYSDTPMAGFATEAAFLGKPAVVGGYYGEDLYKDLDKEWVPPSLFCLPEDIEPAIEKMVHDQRFREDMGRSAYDYVMNHWRADQSAKRFIQLANGNFPEEWLHDPYRSNYFLGMGMPKERLRQIVRELLQRFGDDVFLLSDKPILLSKLIAFATEENSDLSKPDGLEKQGL